MESHLSSSPTKTLSSWWKSFKQRDDASASASPPASGAGAGQGPTPHTATGAHAFLKRPQLPHMSLSSNSIPKRKTSDPLLVLNEGKRVPIPREYASSPIFGAPLDVSIRYASVKISLTDRSGRNFVYGHVPVVVAKCSVYLKQEARTVPGIFRISGSVRRIRLLQDTFNTPPRFGKDTDWQGFSVHDAANIFRRFLNNLPEPIVPLNAYSKFRAVLKNSDIATYMEAQAALLSPAGQGPALSPPVSRAMSPGSEDPAPLAPEPTAESSAALPAAPSDASVAAALRAYEDLVFKLPPVNLHLMVYLLDLLAVFSSHADENLMPAFNLAAVFQPSILSHPQHDQEPHEYRLSRAVVEFLITHAHELLRRVEKLAIDEHERLLAAKTPRAPRADSRVASEPVEAQVPTPAADPTENDTLNPAGAAEQIDPSKRPANTPAQEPETTAAAAGPAVDGAEEPGALSTSETVDTASETTTRSSETFKRVPSLVVTNPADDPRGDSAGHRRVHSKSLSSAHPPRLRSDTDPRTRDSPRDSSHGAFSALRRQVSTSRRSLLSVSHGNDSTASLTSADPAEDDTGERATSPARSDHESMKSRFRRSLLLFRNTGDDEPR